MQITQEMIQAGARRAVELGVLPRKSLPDDIATNSEIVFEIFDAAFNSPPEGGQSAIPENEKK